MTDLTLTEFVPGTKAKAQEVNANFSALKDAVNSNALMGGDSAQTFSVADATLDEHAVNKSQLDSEIAANEVKINNLTNRFCLKSGNLTSGEADLLEFSGTTLSFKIGGGYSSTEWTSADGTAETILTLADVTGLSTNGTYSLIKELGVTNALVTSSKVTQGKEFPTSPSDGDYHCLTDMGLSTHKRVSGAWVDTQYIKLGTVTVAGSLISAVSTTPYFQNGYDINTNTVGKYDSGWFTVSTNTTYTKTHNLGTSNIRYKILLADDVNGTNQRPINYYVIDVANGAVGPLPMTTTRTTLSILTGSGKIGNSSTGGYLTAGYYRILAEVV